MAQNWTPRLGMLELVGIGFAGGVSAGAAYGAVLGASDMAAPLGGGLGVVLVPALWIGVAKPCWRMARRLTARAPATRVTGVVA